MIIEEVGKRIKESRKAAGFTQKQVAEKLNMLQSSYARYESGALELDYEKMIFLCKLLNVSADYLLGLSEY